MPDQPWTPLQGRRVLVVEDDYVLAEEMLRELEGLGAQVLGPVPGVRDALDLLLRETAPDMAILDVNLGGEMVFPLADALADQGIPFVFATAYDYRKLPEAYAAVPRCEKPIDPHALGRALAALQP